MDKKISVIVPIYNVEKYLDKCIQSIINQTYRNLEIILVNDGSPDKCGEMIDGYKEVDSRIKVIHKPNGGLSDARNAGLEVATGDFISFIDSDDWIDTKMYEIMMKRIIQDGSDIAECNISYVYEDKLHNRNKYTYKALYTNVEAMKELILDRSFHQTVWNKIYNRKCIDNIYFEIGKVNEDEFWTYQIFGNAKKISYIEEPLYFYLQRNGSIMNSGYSLKLLDGVEGRYNRFKYIEAYYKELLDIEKEQFLFFCIYHYQSILNSDYICKETLEKLEQYIKEINVDIKMLKNIKLKNQIWIVLSKLSVLLVCRVRNLLGIGTD